jgi:Farnesoic acid 0-methyl transferase
MRAGIVMVVALAGGCKVKDPPPITETWTDNFDRAGIGPDYYKTGPGFSVADHALSAHGAHNHPLWLRRKLTRDIRIEFDCWSNEPRGDIKIELFGDGKSYDPDGGRYTATGYELIFGGWFNSKSEIAKLDEHGTDVAARTDKKVVAKQHYHWKIERVGQTVTWWIDDMQTPFLSWTDPKPLEGASHDYFAFNNWETDTWFDNLVVTPL